jgi:hypothetical protein
LEGERDGRSAGFSLATDRSLGEEDVVLFGEEGALAVDASVESARSVESDGLESSGLRGTVGSGYASAETASGLADVALDASRGGDGFRSRFADAFFAVLDRREVPLLSMLSHLGLAE